MTRDLHTVGPNFYRSWDDEYLSYALNFMTFGNMSQKLWPNILIFSSVEQSGQIRKNHFFGSIFLIGFLELYINGKL